MLCQACTQVFEGQPQTELQHHSTALELQRASENGCQLCRLLWASFSKPIANTGLSQKDVSLTYAIRRGRNLPFLGYIRVPTDLHVLGFSLSKAESITAMDSSTDDEDKYMMLVVEPFGGWSNPQPSHRATSTRSLYRLIISRSHATHWPI